MRARPSPRRDHPRVCGEHPHKAIADSGFPGSSPRVRGTPAALLGSDQHRGSSPRVRGTQNIEIIDNLADGIIPACAGNTGGWQLLVGRHGDHPRVCGEHPRSSSLTMPPAGSSPRVRGTLHVHDVRGGLRGIIPACAGNTTGSFPPAWCRWDHPRVCGEHVFTIPGHIPAWGSSPRVRGTPRMTVRGLGAVGIIPACAGNTLNLRHSALFKRDHPRVCGEHVRIRNLYDPPAGSSPRVRGTRPVRHHAMRKPGIIPACAGNTRG